MSTINNGVLDGTRRVGPGVRELSVNGSLAGAPLGMRLRGATQAGAPAVGSWKAGDHVEDRAGSVWVCTAGGSPGTWVQSGAPIPSLTATQTIYVTTTGSDAGNGLTWGTAKATIAGALTALGVAGSGTTQVNTPGVILLGPGSFTDLNSHLIQSALGLEIIGAGRELTHVQGPDALPWVSFRNSYRCRIKNLTYTGSPSRTGWCAESASYWSGSAWYGSGLSCEQNGAENVDFGDGANSCAYGWRWRCGPGGSASNDPDSDANNDSGVLIGCLFNGCAQPITIEHSNSLLHEIRNCGFSNCGSGITFNGGSAVLSHCAVGAGTTANGGSGWFIDLQPAFGTWDGAAAADYQHQIDILGTSYESNFGYVRSNSAAAGALGGILRVRFTGGELTGQPTLTGNVGIDWENADEGVLTFVNMTLGSGASGGVTLGSSAHPSAAASNITFDDCDVEIAAFYYNGNLLLSQWRNKWSNPTFTGAAANLTAIPYMSGPVTPFLYANTAAGGSNTATVTTANSGGASGNPWGNVSVGSGCTLTYDSTHTFQGAAEAYLFSTAANASAYTAWSLPVATNVYASCWLFFSSATTSLQTNIMSFTGGLGAGTSVAVSANGTLRVATAAGSTANSVTVLATGSGYTLSAHFVIGAGSSQTTVNIYNSTGTLLETVSTNATGTTPAPTEIYWGSSGAGSGTVNTYWLGAIQASSAPLLATGALANVNTAAGVIQATGGTAAAGTSGLLADAAHAHPTGVAEVQPSDLGLIAWTVNPAVFTTTALYATGTYAGRLLFWTFRVPVSASISNINYAVDVIGATISNAYLGIYSMTGSLLGSCATDQSTNMTATGVKTAALGSPLAVTAGTLYRVGLVIGAAATFPTFTAAGANISGTYANAALSAANYMSGYYGTLNAYTALPPSFTPSGAGGGLNWLPVFIMN